MSTPNLASAYEIVSPLGAGMSSHVYLAAEKGTRRLCALKSVFKKADGVNVDKIRREIEIMKECRHPFIIHYHDVTEDENHILIRMEYCEGGTLGDTIMRKGPLPEDIAVVLFSELCFAVHYLHKTRNIIHRDIKLENVLLDENGHVRLSDFGFSTFLEDDEPHKRTVCGTPAYAAPEMITREAYTSKTDVWSLGVLLYVMLTGQIPFRGASIQECMHAVLYDDLVLPPTASLECKDLLIHMLDKDPDQRYDITEVLSHPLISGGRLYEAIKKVAEWDERDIAVAQGSSNNHNGLRQIMFQLLGSMSNNYTPTSVRPWRASSRALRCSFSLAEKHVPRPQLIAGSRSYKPTVIMAPRGRMQKTASNVFVIHHRSRELPKRPEAQVQPTLPTIIDV